MDENTRTQTNNEAHFKIKTESFDAPRTVRIGLRRTDQGSVNGRRIVTRETRSRSDFFNAEFGSRQGGSWNERICSSHVLVRAPSSALFPSRFTSFLFIIQCQQIEIMSVHENSQKLKIKNGSRRV